MGGEKGRRGEHDRVALAAHLRGAAIELLHGREPEPGELALLLEAAATALLDREEQLRGSASPAEVDRLAQIKERYPRAYEPWTPEEEASLRKQHAEGHSMAQIAAAFQRQSSAIRSRLQRLGLEPPSGRAQ